MGLGLKVLIWTLEPVRRDRCPELPSCAPFRASFRAKRRKLNIDGVLASEAVAAISRISAGQGIVEKFLFE